MSAPRVLSCGAAGVDEKRADWAPLDPGDQPSRGARLAILGGGEGVTVLLVEPRAGTRCSPSTRPPRRLSAT